MIQSFDIGSKQSEKAKFKRLKQNLRHLSPEDKRRAKKDIANFEQRANPVKDTSQSEHEIYYIASSKMLRAESEEKLKDCPVVFSSDSRGKCRTVTVIEEDLEELVSWLEHYGCSWQEN